MQRIKSIEVAQATGEAATTLAAIKAKFGTVPNIFKTMAVAPSVLKSYVAFSGAVGEGALSAAIREQISLVSAGTNACDYCASAHQALGKMAGLSADDIALAFKGQASNPKAAAALTFAKKLISDRGQVSDADLGAIRAAGFTDAEALEIVANVALNIFTNYLNLVAGTEIDFPRVDSARAAL